MFGGNPVLFPSSCGPRRPRSIPEWSADHSIADPSGVVRGPFKRGPFRSIQTRAIQTRPRINGKTLGTR